ncbi:MAG TPA: hypothetical protein VGG64_08285 [Pirellulales bacterium]
MSVIQFGCPFCGAVSEVEAGWAGQETSCPACASVLIVPHAEPVVTDMLGVSPFEPPTPAPAPTKKARPRSGKPKLWQAAPRPDAASDTESLRSSELPQPLTAPEPQGQIHPLAAPVPQENLVVDLSSVSSPDDQGPLGGVSYQRRASKVAREERQRRRTVSNAIMLIGSMIVLFAALAGLMYLTGKR